MAASLTVKILGDASGFKHAADQVEGITGKLSSGLGKVAALAGGAFAALQVGSFAKDAVQAASSLNESLSKSTVVFGDQATAIDGWAKTAAKSLGQSRQQALEAAGTYGNLFQAFGIGKTESADMSKNLVTLASDLASFNNSSPDEALQALRSGLSGETEPLKRFGIAINDNRLKAEAFSLGIVQASVDSEKLSRAQETVDKAGRKVAEVLKKNGKNSVEYADATRDLEQAQSKLADVAEGSVPTALTAAQKAQASYSLIMKDSALAQGDFGRTSDGLANKQRILGAQFADIKTQVGSALLPAVLKVTSFISDNMIPAFQRAQEILGPFIEKIKTGVHAMGMAFSGEGITSDGFVGVMERIGVGARVLFDWLEENVPPAVAVIREAFGEAKAWVEENLMPLWPDVRDAVVAAFTAIKDIIVTVVTIAQAWWDRFGDQFVETTRRYIDGALEVVRGLLHMLTGVFQLISDALHGRWSEAWEDVKQIAWAFVSDVIPGVLRAGFASWKFIMDEAATLIIEALRAVIPWAWEAGWDLMSGFAKGLVNFDILGAVDGVAKKVMGRFTSMLGISSPSKVFAGYGRNILEGLQAGLGSMSPTVPVPAMAGVPAGSYGGAGMAAGGGGTVNIYAQSPDAIAEALRRYNKLNGTGWFQ